MTVVERIDREERASDTACLSTGKRPAPGRRLSGWWPPNCRARRGDTTAFSDTLVDAVDQLDRITTPEGAPLVQRAGASAAPLARGVVRPLRRAPGAYVTHACDTGAMRRTHPRGRATHLERVLVHLGAFSPGLLMRHLVGVGTPRGFMDRAASAVTSLAAIWRWLVHALGPSGTLHDLTAVILPVPGSRRHTRSPTRHCRVQPGRPARADG